MVDTMQRILITGTNRGLGLELTRQCAEAGNRVFATCRRPDEASELQALAQAHSNITILALDVADDIQFVVFAESLAAQTDGLDVILHNAGINPRTPEARGFGTLTAAAIQEQVQTNAIGPLLLTQALLPLIQKGQNPIVVMVSSQMGSLQWKQKGGGYAYSMSKSAMNMAARTLAYDLKPQGIRVITLHPGWVITDMGGEEAELTPQESASSIRDLIGKVSLEDSGSFYKWNGTPHVW